ncbi:Crp/Fnr family transcriptional regulator [Rhizobium sp. R72]|uniref:Crp/Fnr family transcriptional regulator n=1 Tax=unclassified Rhizobium TaxID=2613769 RepID=UPI000B53449B|nr:MULTISPECIES: Crp/Fnr family transcriptional regulator [unclassified Rhizobium]OWV96624.1 Crp/Fnr family transcriptional regulator [Rhizobium sp. R72]OWV96642.1 Crp/Fnr family transcriptional regulator [Rhizobium sp. R711]
MLARNPVLLRSELLAGLDRETVETLSALAEVRTFSPHEQIVEEGQKAGFIFCVTSGLVRLTKKESAGREADVSICEPGDIFGEYLLAGGATYAHGAWAAEFTEIVMLDLNRLRSLAQQHQGIQRNIIHIMAKHLLGALDCIAGDRLHTAAQRVANYVVARCPPSASRVTFRLPYQKRILAGKLGLAPEALSRAFAALAPLGVAVKGKNISVESVNLLKEAC